MAEAPDPAEVQTDPELTACGWSIDHLTAEQADLHAVRWELHADTLLWIGELGELDQFVLGVDTPGPFEGAVTRAQVEHFARGLVGLLRRGEYPTGPTIVPEPVDDHAVTAAIAAADAVLNAGSAVDVNGDDLVAVPRGQLAELHRLVAQVARTPEVPRSTADQMLQTAGEIAYWAQQPRVRS